ncbi:hypothetical protein OOU_Y34scaffold00485g19 [Pyricularia oryzae Y34]|uniref:Uncharacterized protein n=2 Tax=Pyricularia oryzae TaxID=318829 RepID=A0AA97P0K6_PYRO3|nr:hypothetical protein OOU_Y34scaffold00485g19 [Pyricularia oryzae Y34]
MSAVPASEYLIGVEARLSDPDLLRGTWWKMAAQLTYDGTTWREMLANCLDHLIGSDTKPRFYTSLLRRVVNMCIISSDEHWWKFVERLTTSWYYLGGYTAVPLVRAVHARSAWLVKLLLDNGADLQAACGSKRRQNISSGLASTKGRCPFSGPRFPPTGDQEGKNAKSRSLGCMRSETAGTTDLSPINAVELMWHKHRCGDGHLLAYPAHAHVLKSIVERFSFDVEQISQLVAIMETTKDMYLVDRERCLEAWGSVLDVLLRGERRKTSSTGCFTFIICGNRVEGWIPKHGDYPDELYQQETESEGGMGAEVVRFGEGDGSRMAEELKAFLKKHPTWHETKESGQAEASLEDVWPAFEEIGVTGTDLVALPYTCFCKKQVFPGESASWPQ